jgi:hypothetical protein
MELTRIVHDFALAMEAVDHRQREAMSHRTAARPYRPGIGPFAEDDAGAPLRDLVHPVFAAGGVFAWEVLGTTEPRN